MVDGVFYSSIICERDNDEEIIDARTSDAIALALRFNAPIFTYQNILDKAGIYLKNNPPMEQSNPEEEKGAELIIEDVLKDATDSPSEETSSNKKSLKELEKELDEAVKNEDYEKAAQLRDEISKRK